MTMQVPELFNRFAHRQGLGERVIPVLIEEHAPGGVRWGVSITSHNPEPEDYHECGSLAEAKALMQQITDGNKGGAA